MNLPDKIEQILGEYKKVYVGNTIMSQKEAILYLIHQAEIKELQRHIIWDGDNVGGILMTRQEVDERISALEKEIVE